MREVGFQFLRVAATSDERLKDNEVKVITPFVDEMIREANAQGMAVSVRLQGYVMNLRSHSDYIMLNNKNEEMEKNWSAFMHSSLFHKGIFKDKLDESEAIQLDAFEKQGGMVYYLQQENGMCGPTTFGWWCWNKERLDNTTLEFRATLETADVFEACEYMPLMTTSNRHLKGGMLEGDDHSLLIFNNTDPAHRDVSNAEVTVYQPFSKAIWMTLDEETELEANGNSIVLPVAKEGGVLLLKR